MSAVSVVVATRNRPLELSCCLDSLLAQTHRPARIVVVDDAPGGDLTPAVVGRFAGSGIVRYVEGKRGGLAAAHNRGLDEVATPLVAFTDDDVVAHEEWLERLVGAFASVPGVGCVTGLIVPHELESAAQLLLEGYAGYGKGPARRVFDLGANRPADPLFPFAAGRFGSGANMAFTRMVLDELGGFDPALGAGTRAMGGDDLAAFFEVLQHGHRLVYEPAAIVRHRHARDFHALKRQVYGYGVGLTAFLTKCVLDRPGQLPVAARQLPAAAEHVLSPRSRKNSRRPAGCPPQLVRLERLGMLAGPFSYVASRLSVRRAARRALIPILLYHSVANDADPRFAEWTVSPDLFAGHMDALASEGYRTLTVGELVQRGFGRKEGVPERTVVITFDDGFEDFYTTAWPQLRRTGLSASVFVTTGLVGSTSTWLERCGEGERPLMSWSQVAEISAAGIECGAHCHAHLQLDLVPLPHVREQIERSRRALAEVIGPVTSFAYPHGYHSRRVRREVRRAGFTSACAVGDGLAAASDDPFAITRAVVRRGTSVETLLSLVGGAQPTRRSRPVRRIAWRSLRRAGAEPLVERLRAGRSTVPT